MSVAGRCLIREALLGRDDAPYEGTEIPPRLQHLWIFFERTAPPKPGS